MAEDAGIVAEDVSIHGAVFTAVRAVEALPGLLRLRGGLRFAAGDGFQIFLREGLSGEGGFFIIRTHMDAPHFCIHSVISLVVQEFLLAKWRFLTILVLFRELLKGRLNS